MKKMMAGSGRTIWRYAPILILWITAGIFLSRSLAYIDGCKAVFRYTIPAISPDIAEPFWEHAYWQKTTLTEHFMTMPPSAKGYFTLHCAGGALYGGSAIVTGVLACKTMLYRGPEGHTEEL